MTDNKLTQIAKQLFYIHNKLQGYDQNFINVAENMFINIIRSKEADGCISNTVMLYICAKFYRLNARLCYGVVEVKGLEFYHMWLELDDIIIDLSIYGNINFPHPLFLNTIKNLNIQLYYPNIGPYQTVTGKYYRFRRDSDYFMSNISRVEGTSIHEYMSFMNTVHDDRLWYLCCSYLGAKSNVQDMVAYLKELTADDYITESGKGKQYDMEICNSAPNGKSNQ